MSKEIKKNELIKEAVENVTEEELQEIAAAGDTNPEITPTILIGQPQLNTGIHSCVKGFC